MDRGTGEGENDTARSFGGFWKGMWYQVQLRRVRCWHRGKLAWITSKLGKFWALGKACGFGNFPKLVVVPTLH